MLKGRNVDPCQAFCVVGYSISCYAFCRKCNVRPFIIWESLFCESLFHHKRYRIQQTTNL